MKYLAVIMLLAFFASAAKAEIILMECNPEKNKSLTRIILIEEGSHALGEVLPHTNQWSIRAGQGRYQR
jgi:hypothetical protein